MAGFFLALASLQISCIKYQPHELNPVQTEQQFRARTVANPGLADFVHAQTGAASLQWPPAKLTPETLTWIAYFFNPAIEASRAKVAAANAAVGTARQRINPTFSAEGGYNKTPDSVSTWAVSPAFTIETAGKRGYRILEAQKLAEASRIAVWESAWQVRSGLRKALAARWAADSKLELLRSEEAIRKEIATIYQKRVELGESSNPELTAGRSELAALAVSISNAEGEQATALAAIAESTGLPLTALAGTPLDLTAFSNPTSPDQLPLLQVERAGLLHRADIRRSLVEYEAIDARLRLVLANQYPNITLSPSYTFQEGFPAYALGSILESLPVFHRNQGPIAEQEAARREAEAKLKALQAQIVGETESALTQYRVAVNEWTVARDTYLLAQHRREVAVQASFRAGESDRLDLTQARLLTLTAQRVQLDALTRAQAALAALEDAVQAPLSGGLPAPRPETTN